MRCYIIDDEPLARRGLKEFIERTPKLMLVGEANNPVEALNSISEAKPDLLFLDIQMPHLSGIEFVRQFKPDMHIVYTTAYSSYAVESFDLDIKDYLLKPLKYDRFLRAVNRVYQSQIQNKVEENSIFVRVKGEWLKIEFDQILYLNSVQNYVKIWMEQRSVIVHQTLKSFEEELPTTKFMKVQKSFIINREKIERFDGYFLHIRKHKIPVSRKLIQDVKEKLLGISS